MPPSTERFIIELLKDGHLLVVDVPGWLARVELHAPDMGAARNHARELSRMPPYAGADACRITAPGGAAHTFTL